MKVLSLFDGISCGMVALERAGFKVERYVAYEIDKYAIAVSKKTTRRSNMKVTYSKETSRNIKALTC